MRNNKRFFLNQKELTKTLIIFLISFTLLSIFINILIKKIFQPNIIISLYQPKQLKCLPNGWPERGTRVFWKNYYYPELPTLQDAFEDNGVLTIILSCMLLNTHPDYYFRMASFFAYRWALYFHQSNSPVYKDSPINAKKPIFGKVVSETDEKKILVIQFEIPKMYQNRFHYATIQTVNHKEKKVQYRPVNKNEVNYRKYYIQGETELQGYQNYTKLFLEKINNDKLREYGMSYRNIPFCQIIDQFSKYSKNYRPKEKDFLRICTENLIFADKERNVDLLRWALYHRDQGFETPIVYYNKIIPKDNQHPENLESYYKIKKKAMKILKKAIDDGVIELINWEFPYAFYFHDQIGQEASCIYRNKNRTLWLGINDVDEYFYNPNQKTKDTVNITMSKIYYSDFISKYGGIITPNVWMKIENGKVYQDDVYTEFERTKCIIVPDNVFAFSVHTVENGLPTVSFTKNNIVNAHFKKVSDDAYTKLFESEKMTNIFKKYNRIAREYLGLRDDDSIA